MRWMLILLLAGCAETVTFQHDQCEMKVAHAYSVEITHTACHKVELSDLRPGSEVSP